MVHDIACKLLLMVSLVAPSFAATGTFVPAEDIERLAAIEVGRERVASGLANIPACDHVISGDDMVACVGARAEIFEELLGVIDDQVRAVDELIRRFERRLGARDGDARGGGRPAVRKRLIEGLAETPPDVIDQLDPEEAEEILDAAEISQLDVEADELFGDTSDSPIVGRIRYLRRLRRDYRRLEAQVRVAIGHDFRFLDRISRDPDGIGTQAPIPMLPGAGTAPGAEDGPSSGTDPRDALREFRRRLQR